MSDAENLDIKKRARRRLVGAVALALLAAVVLPMIMEQEPHPAVQDIQITIPEREGADGLRRLVLHEASHVAADHAHANLLIQHLLQLLGQRQVLHRHGFELEA